MTDPAIALLRALVSIDSVNPSLVPGGAGEREIAGAVAAELERIGLAVEYQDAAPGRPNVVGVLEGRSPGPSLLLCGHMDTVGVEGMSAPFQPVEREGRLYGRGAQDMKGGLAAIMDAARVLVAEGGLARGRLLVAAVADEEHGSLGAQSLTRRWRADAAVVAEPTDLLIAVGHKGFSWARIETHGRAAHGSRPDEGKDAILSMGKVLSRLDELNSDLQSRRADPLLGTGSLHASLIEGGRELSTYPDHCALSIERRIVTGEPLESAALESEEILAGLRAADPDFRGEVSFLFGRAAYRTPPECRVPALLESALARRGVAARRGAMTYWTDAAILGEAGTPSVVFGPGGAGLHGLEEYVRVDEVVACRDAIVSLAREFCGSAR